MAETHGNRTYAFCRCREIGEPQEKSIGYGLLDRRSMTLQLAV